MKTPLCGALPGGRIAFLFLVPAAGALLDRLLVLEMEIDLGVVEPDDESLINFFAPLQNKVIMA